MTPAVASPSEAAVGAPTDELAVAALAVARAFAAGATMWCVSEEWPAHGRHVAVEFVHPVIVGKRALPAVHCEGPDLVGTVRLLARPGDLLMVVGSSAHRPSRDLLRRAQPWGLARLWVGAGDRPASELAEHIVWLEGIDPAVAARSGDLVLVYHLLWELVHVAMEHPGLLAPPATPGDAEVCITCSDEGEVAEVRAARPDGRAEVVVRGHLDEVDVTLVGPVSVGELLLVHAGVAITALEDR